MSAELKRSLSQLEKAFARLREALDEPPSNPLMLDGSIQRFEFSIELFWKVMKRLLAFEGIDARTPRETLQQAFQSGWLADEATWLSLLRDRNQTSHAYDEALAQAILARVRRALPEMAKTLDELRQRIDQI
ncbi:MAG TPA: HI0074 family nucleotidyltransferase substrate-binding subunit [Terriglobales bacterium]|nr:HI0074 family nucleotidyltransferase substrate-binding subunit [Terriglobales bacterium]